MPEKEASYRWAWIGMAGFMVGRFTGTFLMRYIKPPTLLLCYSIISMVLLALALITKGNIAVYCVLAVPFFMSIMFPTIFALGIDGLGARAKMASPLLVMAIVGGAIFPLLMGQVSDLSGGNIQLAYIVPLLCFAIVAWFAYTQIKKNVPVPA
jgi:FHS family L-fucose permease-like MFS transporter